MKKIKKIIQLFCFMSLIAACDPISYHDGEWYIKNYTDQTLTISFPPFHARKDGDVAAGDSLLVQLFHFEYKGKVIPYFDRLPQVMASYNEDVLLDVSCNVLSEHGDLLKRWRYIDKDLSGKQFFNESSWHYYQFHRSRDKEHITAVWVFDILPEDLIEENEH